MEFLAEYLLIPGTPFGDLQVRYYGIIIVTAMLIAASVAASLARRSGYDSDHVWGGLTWAIFPGIVLARLWFVLFPPVSLTVGCDPDVAGVCQDTAWYIANFFNLENGAIAIWSGGLSIFGAVLGGLLGAWLYMSPWHNSISRVFHYIFLPVGAIFAGVEFIINQVVSRVRGEEPQGYELPKFEPEFPDEGMPIGPWLDLAAVALPLAQVIGRFANYVNQELYGLPTGVDWWGLNIDRANRVGEYQDLVTYPIAGNVTLFHPLFLYEAIWSALAFYVLYRLYVNNRDKFMTGDFFLLYLAQYSFIRFFLEFLRIEVAYLPGTSINSSQVFTAAVFVFALSYFFFRRRNGIPEKNQPESVTE